VGNSITSINNDITDINSDITTVNNTIGTLDNRINLLEAFSDGVVNITRGPYFPSGARDGDLHYRSDQGDRLYRRSNGSWVESSDDRIAQALAAAIDAEALADSKAKIFAQANQPVASGVGDLWLESDNKYKQRRWNGSSWQDVDRLQSNVIETLHVVNNAISNSASDTGSLSGTSNASVARNPAQAGVSASNAAGALLFAELYATSVNPAITGQDAEFYFVMQYRTNGGGWQGVGGNNAGNHTIMNPNGYIEVRVTPYSYLEAYGNYNFGCNVKASITLLKK
jgi:hypothetical protein